MPALSILIPAPRRGGGDRRLPCDHLLVQEYNGPLEILVLDDQSTDGTADAICDAAGDDSSRPAARGRSGAGRLEGQAERAPAIGSAAATGEMLLLTDADCVFLPGALNAVVRHPRIVRRGLSLPDS